VAAPAERFRVVTLVVAFLTGAFLLAILPTCFFAGARFRPIVGFTPSPPCSSPPPS